MKLGHHLVKLLAKLPNDVRRLGSPLLDFTHAALEGSGYALDGGVRVIKAPQRHAVPFARGGAAPTESGRKIVQLGRASPAGMPLVVGGNTGPAASRGPLLRSCRRCLGILRHVAVPQETVAARP
jgi:hypothetical protein